MDSWSWINSKNVVKVASLLIELDNTIGFAHRSKLSNMRMVKLKKAFHQFVSPHPEEELTPSVRCVIDKTQIALIYLIESTKSMIARMPPTERIKLRKALSENLSVSKASD